MFDRRIPAHAHWFFMAYDSKDEVQQVLYGAVEVDVVASTYDEARRKVEEYRPRTGDKAGYQLKRLVEHLPGFCS